MVAVGHALPVPRDEALVLGDAETVPAAALPEPEDEAEAQGLALRVLLGQLLADNVPVLLRDTVAHWDTVPDTVEVPGLPPAPSGEALGERERLMVVEVVAVAHAVDDREGLAEELGVMLPLPLALTVPLTLSVAQSVGEVLGLPEEVEQGHTVGLVLTDRVRVTLGLLEAVAQPEGVRVLE